MKILIIEDEQPAARQLAKLLSELDGGNTQILETLDSVEAAVHWLRTFTPPDLIFMDIQVADGLSFDIFKQVEVKSPVIFTTAFDQYAVRAFRVNAVDYLLKPVDPDELQLAIDKVMNKQKAVSVGLELEALERFFDKKEYKDRFLIKSGANFGFLQTADVAFFRSDNSITQAYTKQGKSPVVEHTLDELESLLNPKDFFRINRNMLVSLGAIQKISPYLNGRLVLETSPDLKSEVIVSREKVAEFKVWLGG
ncbi:MAG: response regulator transcription factor [Chitinophagales bacterium]|nr:response regulator transcription factor [Chitinophagales bacterium]